MGYGCSEPLSLVQLGEENREKNLVLAMATAQVKMLQTLEEGMEEVRVGGKYLGVDP